MNQRLNEQLDKVLALADSSHEGEAVGAVRMARQMLSRDGLSFSDLARAASSRSRFTLPISLFSGQQAHLETQNLQLQQQVNDLKASMESQAAQLDFWCHRAAELEQQLNLHQAEARRWKHLARETIEKLWDSSQAMEGSAATNPASDMAATGPAAGYSRSKKIP